MRITWIRRRISVPIPVLPCVRSVFRRVAGSVRSGACRAAGRAQPIPLDSLREDVYRACVAAAAGPPGVFRPAAPTGTGKTISAAGVPADHPGGDRDAGGDG